jgi:hypothetical protein
VSDETTTTETETDEIIFPRMTDEMTKKELTDHIREHHGVRAINGFTVSSTMKLTKGELINWHTRQHEVVENPDAVFHKDAGEWRNGKYSGLWTAMYKPSDGGRSYQTNAYPFLVAHKHDDIISAATEEQLAAASRARSNERVSDKPLSPAERKVLKELVDNDFNALKSETQQFAADALESRKSEVELDWADAKEKIPALVDEMIELKRKQKDEMAALEAKHETQRQRIRDKADKSGIVLKEGYQGDVQGEVQGLKDALRKVNAENEAMLQRALMTLERQRLTAQRQVLISGVTKESAEILDTIPDAKTLMVDAQRQQAALQAGSSEA